MIKEEKKNSKKRDEVAKLFLRPKEHFLFVRSNRIKKAKRQGKGKHSSTRKQIIPNKYYQKTDNSQGKAQDRGQCPGTNADK